MRSKVEISLMQINIKSMFLEVNGYELVCLDDTFSKPFMLWVTEHAVYSFLIVFLKKINTTVMWWKDILIKKLWCLKTVIKNLGAGPNILFEIFFKLSVMVK